MPHVMRAGADPAKSYVDERIAKLTEKVHKMANILKTLNGDRWKYIEEHAVAIFIARESDLVS